MVILTTEKTKYNDSINLKQLHSNKAGDPLTVNNKTQQYVLYQMNFRSINIKKYFQTQQMFQIIQFSVTKNEAMD